MKLLHRSQGNLYSWWVSAYLSTFRKSAFHTCQHTYHWFQAHTNQSAWERADFVTSDCRQASLQDASHPQYASTRFTVCGIRGVRTLAAVFERLVRLFSYASRGYSCTPRGLFHYYDLPRRKAIPVRRVRIFLYARKDYSLSPTDDTRRVLIARFVPYASYTKP